MRSISAVTLPLVAALLITGCGSGGSNTAAAVSNAPDSIAKAGPTKIVCTFTYGPFRGQATGVVDAAGRKSRLDLQMAGIGHVTEIIDASHAYFKFPPGLFQMKKPWIDINLQNPPTTGTLGTTAALAYGGPILMLDELRGATTTDKIGDEQVSGVPTTHYLVTVDLRKVVTATPQAARDSVRLAIDHTIKGQGGSAIAHTNVWIGRDGLIRRQSSIFGVGGSRYGFDITYVGFGKGQSVQPPPRSLVSANPKL
jgi:hypothetical protein